MRRKLKYFYDYMERAKGFSYRTYDIMYMYADNAEVMIMIFSNIHIF